MKAEGAWAGVGGAAHNALSRWSLGPRSPSGRRRAPGLEAAKVLGGVGVPVGAVRRTWTGGPSGAGPPWHLGEAVLGDMDGG